MIFKRALVHESSIERWWIFEDVRKSKIDIPLEHLEQISPEFDLLFCAEAFDKS